MTSFPPVYHFHPPPYCFPRIFLPSFPFVPSCRPPSRTWHLISSALVLYPPSLWRNETMQRRRVSSRGGAARQVFNKSGPAQNTIAAASWRVCLSNILFLTLLSHVEIRGTLGENCFSNLFLPPFISYFFFFYLFFICQGFIVSFIFDIPLLHLRKNRINEQL